MRSGVTETGLVLMGGQVDADGVQRSGRDGVVASDRVLG